MHFLIISFFLTLLLCQTLLGMDIASLLRSGKSNTDNTYVTGMPSKSPLDEDSDISSNNSSYGLSLKNITEGYRLDAEGMDLSTTNGITSLQSEFPNSTIDNKNQSQNTAHYTNELKSDYSTSISTVQNMTGNSTNEFPQSSQAHSSSQSPKSTVTITSSTKSSNSSPQPDDEESEGVVVRKPSNSSSPVTSQPKTIYQRTLELINDTYTLSVLLPIAAGVVFAATIIVVIATCRCIKRQCRRRRLRKKTLPDSVKNLRPSDRARLLAESSDEEF